MAMLLSEGATETLQLAIAPSSLWPPRAISRAFDGRRGISAPDRHYLRDAWRASGRDGDILCTLGLRRDRRALEPVTARRLAHCNGASSRRSGGEARRDPCLGLPASAHLRTYGGLGRMFITVTTSHST
ncbi:hypothetical protein KC359_g134 [Hortaea werneckii]|nr:hypothetical protein KC359_g134 [Hortaea werneckii]